MSIEERSSKDAMARKRRKWWLVVLLAFAGCYALQYKPQRYYDEAATMERIAELLNSPVPYVRQDGLSTRAQVNTVYLPRVELNETTTRELSTLLNHLPYLDTVCVQFISDDQMKSLDQLKEELPSEVMLAESITSTEASESRQARTYVAGIYSD